MKKIKSWEIEQDGRTKTLGIKKIGNWDIGLIKYFGNPKTFLMVRGLDYGENPIIYSDKKKVGYDRPYKIPDSVKKYILNHAEKLYDLLTQKNNN